MTFYDLTDNQVETELELIQAQIDLIYKEIYQMQDKDNE